jgi:L-methionine (R)-S-oxide reductase
MVDVQLSAEMSALVSEIRKMAADVPSFVELQQGIVTAIAGRLPYYNWTGFYMLDPEDSEMLVLGAFVGEPTPHVRIPVTEGICGAAVALGKTVVVEDVNADPRYLSCSIKTRSEIVAPVYVDGRAVGEIDVDSHAPGAFSEVDRLFLEEVAGMVGEYVAAHGLSEKRTSGAKAPGPPENLRHG